MSDFIVRIYKNKNSNKPPAIALPANLPQQELMNPALIKTARSLFEANGVLTIDNLFSQDAIAHLYRSFVECYQSYFRDEEDADTLAVGDRRKMLTVDFKTPFNDPALYGNPFLLHLMGELLGTGFVLGSLGAVISLPGADRQHVHRDHPSLFEDEELDAKIPSFAITAVVPLIDLTPATGSTRVWKGSHRIPHSDDFDFADSFVPFLPMGSCYLMDYQLLHGGTPNVSSVVRPILYLTYYRSWFQESVNYEKQSRIAIAKQEYQKIPEPYKFLFTRVRESIAFGNALEQKLERKVNRDRPTRDSNRDSDRSTSSDRADRLEAIAKRALASYGFEGARIKSIARSDNAVFSVVVPDSMREEREESPYASNRFVLRIYRSPYLSADAIASELRWLQWLRREAELPVPEPVPTLEGKLWTLAGSPETSEPHVCALTRWVKGRSLQDSSSQLRLSDFESVGRLMGRLHRCAENGPIPTNLTRPSWNWNGLFGNGAGYSDRGALVWERTPQPYRSLFEAVSDRVKTVMASLGEEKEQFGLIHGDFWLGNLLAWDNEIRPIDFTDCGFGYWGYDLARFLSDFSRERDFSIFLDKFLHGYHQIRSFPKVQLDRINTFLAAQHVSLALWQIDRAPSDFSLSASLEKDLKETAAAIEAWDMLLSKLP